MRPRMIRLLTARRVEEAIQARHAVEHASRAARSPLTDREVAEALYPKSRFWKDWPR